MDGVKRFGDYWRRAFGCPFYQNNGEDILRCEAGHIRFDTREGIQNFLDTCEVKYLSCPIYKARMIDYEVKEREEYEAKCRELAEKNKRVGKEVRRPRES